MRVAGMRGQNTSDIATTIHQNLLSRDGLLPDDEKLSYGYLAPRGPQW